MEDKNQAIEPEVIIEQPETPVSDDIPSITSEPDGVLNDDSKENAAVPEYIKGEKPRESAKRILKAIEEKNALKKDEVVQKVREDTLKPQKPGPSRLNGEERDAYSQLDPKTQKIVDRALKDLESSATKRNQSLAEKEKHLDTEISEVRGFKESIIPYAKSWAEKSIPWTEGVLSLARAQERLTNPETSLKTYIALGKDLGHLTNEEAEALLTASTTSNPVAEQNSQIKALQDEINQLKGNWTQKEEAAQLAEAQQRALPITEQLRTVVNEVKADGWIKYPELQNEAYVKQLEPRIAENYRNNPEAGWAEAFKLANAQHKQELFGIPYENQTEQVRPLTTSNDIQQNAINAAVTVRGRTSSNGLASASFQTEPPPELMRPGNGRKLGVWVMEQMKNR